MRAATVELRFVREMPEAVTRSVDDVMALADPVSVAAKTPVASENWIIGGLGEPS